MTWYINTDGGSRGNPGIAGYGVVIAAEDGRVVFEASEYLGTATNNVAEYSAVVDGLQTIADAGVDGEVVVRADSKLVVEQLSGRWKIKNPEMRELALRAKRALPPGRVRYEWIPRERNKAADALANKAMDAKAGFRRGSLGGGREAASTTPGGAAEPATRGGSASARTKPSGAREYRGPHPSVTLVFLRHGETSMTERAGYSGGSEPGPPLSARGREQVAGSALLLAKITALWPDIAPVSQIWTSPMVRTRETADYAGEALEVRPREIDDLREADFGAWQGLTTAEIDDAYPGQLERWQTTALAAPPGGESNTEVGERILNVAHRALLEHPGETVLLTCHSIAAKTGIGALMNLPVGNWHGLRIPPASLSIVRLWPDAQELVALGLPSALGVAESQETAPTLF